MHKWDRRGLKNTQAVVTHHSTTRYNHTSHCHSTMSINVSHISQLAIFFVPYDVGRCPFHVDVHCRGNFKDIVIIICPLTARVVGAPQMISQPVSSIFPCSPLPSEIGELQACPFPDVVYPPLPLSALSSSRFHCALQDGFG